MDRIIENILNNDLRRFRHNCPPDITDRVFEIIQNRFIRQYNVAVNRRGVFSVNTRIGKMVKVFWNLQNTGRNYTPQRSSLIKSYTMHSN